MVLTERDRQIDKVSRGKPAADTQTQIQIKRKAELASALARTLAFVSTNKSHA